MLELLDEEDEEGLVELAKVLSAFLDYIGGRQHAGHLFKILEMLLVVDDHFVRNEALISFKFILSQVSPSDHESELMELIKRLCKGDASCLQISGLHLISTLYTYFKNENRAILKAYINSLAKTEYPMLKKEVASSLKDLAGLLDAETICGIILLFQKDSNDTIRIPIMDVLVALKFNSEFQLVQDFVAKVIPELASDESWRVRLTVADKISDLLGYPYISSFLKSVCVETFAKLFTDSEGETRNVCCIKLENVAELIGREDSFDKILVELKKVEKDETSYVRSSLASSLLRIAPLIGKTKTNDFVFPVFLNMINDESHEVRMTLIKNLDRLHEVINIDMFVQSIIPSLLEIAGNKSWRVRMQITESIPVIARILVNSS
jgi:serine/threonine-protein phosphatase 2A regulatory subunit A